MLSGDIQPGSESPLGDHTDYDLKEKDVLHDEVLVNEDLMNTAFDGENREHEMGILAAIKMYPMACFWAFIFCFTIVSPSQPSGSLYLAQNYS